MWDVVVGEMRRGKGLKSGKAVDSQQAGYQRGIVREGREGARRLGRVRRERFLFYHYQ
jgi:hypothetical protein